MNKIRSTKGITLISLVVTIILLLILAGVTIATLTGENGLLNSANRASEEVKYAQAEEKVKLAVNASYDGTANVNKDLLKENINKIEGLYEKVNEITFDLSIVVDGYEFQITQIGQVIAVGRSDKLPPVTPQTDAGKEVALKDGWGTETMRYVKTDNGEEVKEVTKVATVYAVSDGQGNAIPVPYGFYYVGGNLNSGVIISDNPEDKYEAGKDKTTYAYTTSLKGNQFIWIPCSASEYKKTSWGKQNAEWDTTTPKAELSQIEKYGGFYVARYEAGLASTITEFTTNQKNTGSNSIYNLDGVPQSKAGVVPWMFIDWTHSKANAESMYNNNYVSSGLITGTQWDVILNTLINKAGLTSADITNSSAWGNYRNTTLSYNGRLAVGDYNKTNSSAWTLKPFGSATTGTTSEYASDYTYGDLLTTGASSTTEKYHIFDLAGNLWEWTEEDSHYATSGQYRVIRGGSSLAASGAYPACYRNGSNTVSHTNLNIVFRAVLYIK